MRGRLPGLTWEDRFAGELAASIGTRSSLLVAVPPGRGLRECADSLGEAVADSGGPSVHAISLTEDLQSPDWLVGPLAASLALEHSHGEPPEDLVVRNAGRLDWPQLVVLLLPESASSAACRAASDLAERFSSATKDLRGPVTFVLLFRLQRRAAMDGCLVWSPLTPLPDPPPFWDSSQALVRAGFNSYLGLRAYWEAAGQPQYLDRFAAVFEFGNSLLAAPEPDQRIDAILDRLGACSQLEPAEMAELFKEAFDPAAARSVVKTGVVLDSRLPLETLQAAGLAWCPPGCPRAVLTSLAARALLESPTFTAAQLVSPAQCQALRRVSRRNPLLSTWVGSLASHVEREMLAICQREADLPALVDDLGLTPGLVLERTRSPRHFAYDASDDLVTYCSFGELQALITKTRLAEHFPVSGRRINEIRQIRNLTAHQHPVTWRAARCVLETIEQLLSRRC